MPGRLRSFIGWSISICLVLLLGSCSSVEGGLNSFQSPDGRYGFLYPTGWTRVAVSDGPQVVFHDLINSDETLSLVVSEVSDEIKLESLGTPEVVGQTLLERVIAPSGAGREFQLINASQREDSDHIFYDLEYLVRLSDRDRHELSTVVLDRGYLYTFATSTNEERWPKVKRLFERVVSSFTFLV